jgi:hypothetical protein
MKSSSSRLRALGKLSTVAEVEVVVDRGGVAEFAVVGADVDTVTAASSPSSPDAPSTNKTWYYKATVTLAHSNEFSLTSALLSTG